MLSKNLLFNPNGNDKRENKRVIGGNSTNIFNLNESKYLWCKPFTRMMNGNFWLPEKVDMSQDKVQFDSLNQEQKIVYKSILSFLTFLDSIQTNNIPNIIEYITAPEITGLLVIQEYQEFIHSMSYAYIIESVIPVEERNSVYDLWRDNDFLLNRNKVIASFYQDFVDNQTQKNFYKVLIANYILESIFFYNGFIFFYSLAKENKMMGTADEIRFIQTDEECFVEGTEVLTSDGWADFRDIHEHSKIAQYNIDSSEITFVEPLKIIKNDYIGDMVRFYSKRGTYESIVTPNHDVVINNRRTNKKKKVKAQDLKFSYIYDIPTSGFYKKGNKDFDCLDQLLIALQADGTIDKERTGARKGNQILKFSFKRERKIKRFEQILKDCSDKYNIESTHYKTADGYSKYYVKYPNSLLPIPDKNFDWLKIEESNVDYSTKFIKELIEWDGYKPTNPNHTYTYYSNTNEVAIDKIQAVCAVSNIKCTRTIQVDNRKESYKDVHRLYFFLNSNSYQTQKLKKENIPYSGKVYCVTVPNGAIITRYKGSVTVSGNCHIQLYANIINDIKSENDDFLTQEEVLNMFNDAIKLELEWNNSIFKNHKYINEETTRAYVYHLANKALNKIGINEYYPNGYNPYKDLENVSVSNNDNIKSNFFEATVTNYSQSTVLDGWDEI